MSHPFERYRSNTLPFTVARLIGGTIVILACWFGISLVLVSASVTLRRSVMLARPEVFELWAILAGFSGIWLGLWLVMRYIHGEPLAKLFGFAQRLSSSDGLKGFLAVLFASAVAEVALSLSGYSVLSNSTWGFATWLSLLPCLALLTLVQTTGEEMLFRGYLMRGLASSHRNAGVWAGIPSLLFLLFHYSPDMSPHMLVLQALGIISITALLVLAVVRTGNLGGSMGLHFGNNIFIFAGISHEPGFAAQSLVVATPAENHRRQHWRFRRHAAAHPARHRHRSAAGF